MAASALVAITMIPDPPFTTPACSGQRMCSAPEVMETHDIHSLVPEPRHMPMPVQDLTPWTAGLALTAIGRFILAWAGKPEIVEMDEGA